MPENKIDKESQLAVEKHARRLKATALAAVLEARAFMSLAPLDEEILELCKVFLHTIGVSSAWLKLKTKFLAKLIVTKPGQD